LVALAIVVSVCLQVAPAAHAEEPGATDEGERSPPDSIAEGDRAEHRSPPESINDEDAAVAASLEGIGAAALPGFVVHGTGLWIGGDARSARNLRRLEGAAIALAIVSGGVIGATGASRRISAQTIPFFVASTGVFLQTWLADIYGSAGGGRRGAVAREDVAPLELELGALHVLDDQFDLGVMSRVAGRWRFGALRLEPEMLVAIGDDNQRLRGRVSYEIWGPNGRRKTSDGTALELAAGGRFHRYGDDMFWATSIEGSIAGRLDGRRLGPSLAGSFADLELGFGVEATRYRTGDEDTDTSDALIIRFGYGLYIGSENSSVRGEASLYYDHRRDELAGGVSPGDALAGGFLGFFGAELELDIGERFGFVTSAEFGSAIVTMLSLRARFGKATR